MMATGGELVEYPMRANALCRDLVGGVPGLQDGYVRAADEPGLGIGLNAAIVDQYQYV